MWVRVENLSIAVSFGAIDVDVVSFSINDYKMTLTMNFSTELSLHFLVYLLPPISNPKRPEDSYESCEFRVLL